MNVPIERIEVSACRVPTEQPESDGTLTWDSTTIVIAQVADGGLRGIGYLYTDRTAASLIQDRLAPLFDRQRSFGDSGAMAGDVQRRP